MIEQSKCFYTKTITCRRVAGIVVHVALWLRLQIESLIRFVTLKPCGFFLQLQMHAWLATQSDLLKTK